MRRILATLAVVLLIVAAGGAAQGGEENEVIPLEKALGNPPATGLLVIAVAEGTQAAEKGVEAGDVLVSYGGMPTPTLEALTEAKAKASADDAETVEAIFVRLDRSEVKVELADGQLGITPSPVEKGKGAAPLPPATKFAFDFTPLTADPHDDWYAFYLGGDEKKGFEHAIVTRKDGRIVMRREVAFDGGEQWGVNHFDVTVEVTAEDVPRLVLVKFENPITGFVGEGEMKAGDDGGLVLHYAWRVDGSDKSGRRETTIPADLPGIPSYLVETLACFMPREKGACLHYRPIVDGWGTIDPRSALVCVGEEEIELGGEKVKTTKYEQHRLGGAVSGAYWIDADGHVVKSDYGGPIILRTNKVEALRDLHEKIHPRTLVRPRRTDGR